MERTCGKCKGQGGFAKRRTVNLSQIVSGDLGWVKCSVCDGSGINPNYREKNCDRCGFTIGYHKDSKFPPKYCRNCKAIVDEEKAAKQRERERQAGLWKEKPCPGLQGQGYCGKTIKYRLDWDKIPDICSDCKTQARALKAERDAKWKEKPCADCGRPVKYNVDWEHPPSFCQECKQQRNARHESRDSANPRFHAACGKDGADLTAQEKDRFSEYFHQLPDRQRMPFEKIVQLAREWRDSNGGGFRRSDRR